LRTSTETAADYIRKRVVVDASGCWLWRGRKEHRRYGFACWQRRRVKAHRFAWMIFVGDIPDGIFVLHRCDVPSCCNPDHLFLGTQADNVADCYAKGRNGPMPYCPPELRARGANSGMVRYPGLLAGEKNGRSKITDTQRAEIKTKRMFGTPRWMLALEYGVSDGQVGRICSGIKVEDKRVWRPEARARASIRMRGRIMSKEAIEKTAAAHRGMKRSEETKARLRAAWVLRRKKNA
jgi:hypothetical protein